MFEFIVNECYVPHRHAYQRKYKEHDFLIFGYEKNLFYMLGYDDTSHYSETEIGIDDFLDAFNGVN